MKRLLDGWCASVLAVLLLATFAPAEAPSVAPSSPPVSTGPDRVSGGDVDADRRARGGPLDQVSVTLTTRM